MLEILDRVGAISHTENDKVYLFGFGVYMGNEVPPPGILFMGMDLNQYEMENPKIVLDDGKVVWGCECYWGPEEDIKSFIGDHEVVSVDIEEMRSKFQEEVDNESEN